MKLVPVALMYLGSFAFLGADTAPLDVAKGSRKKWNQRALSNSNREVRASVSYPTGLGDWKARTTRGVVQPLDVKGASGKPQSSGPDAARVKRDLQKRNLRRPRGGCRLGTCSLHELADRIHQVTDKNKDFSAPPIKLSPKGYGRRRRSAPLSAESLVREGPTSRAH
ncbi:pro-adrenomedullin [Sorex fumeus]|uniref:pro-adrenomedullin n=1 Tax=Sorex fumeus TaxID=62283 RepID=UPI0024ADE57C|nr:pro-adrenomedullin [Sorex fumeus]